MNISNTKIKVGIIDDHKLMRNCLFNCLTIWGYQVIIVAENTNDFFDQISEANVPDICITDLNLPELNGYETIKILKKYWPSIKVIVYSLDIEPGKIFCRMGADAIISKLDPVALLKNSLQELSYQLSR